MCSTTCKMFIFNLTLVRFDLLLQLQILFFSSLANHAKMFQRRIILWLCFQTLCEEFEHKRYKMFIQLLEEENSTVHLCKSVYRWALRVCARITLWWTTKTVMGWMYGWKCRDADGFTHGAIWSRFDVIRFIEKPFAGAHGSLWLNALCVHCGYCT